MTALLAAGSRPDPRTVACPACQAPPGQPCTAPTVSGRTPVVWVHSARQDRAEDW